MSNDELHTMTILLLAVIPPSRISEQFLRTIAYALRSAVDLVVITNKQTNEQAPKSQQEFPFLSNRYLKLAATSCSVLPDAELYDSHCKSK